ncbi:efflux RND transporter periplasmic adaptor subunit [Allorhizobium borbori]|uniref:HlyD family secretion protein n=1 Tax=Allorhizobium borbori TaxID=485907 RepID=A0A7W6K3H3_9HYPH|nr:HlyD family secretion protein [Allorhizobium borbori]
MSVLPLHDRPDAITEAQAAPRIDARADTQPVEEKPERVFKRPPSRPKRLDRTLLVGAVLAVAACVSVLALRYAVPHTVDLLTVTSSRFQPELSGPGVLDATVRANVGSSLQGIVTALPFDRNDVVTTGDVIAEIGAHDLSAGRDAALASREAARKAVEATAADVTRMQATLENARRTLARQSELLRSGVGTQSAYEGAQTTVRQAEADLAKAGSALLQAEAQDAAAAANVVASQALLDKSVIRAPIDGVVVSRTLNPGDVASPSSVIMTIVDPASIVLSARFDESVIARLEPGQMATIRFGGNGEALYRGTVRRIAREVDQETREFTVDIAPVRLPPNWALGQRGTAVIDLGEVPGVLAVPVASIARRDGHAGVWVESEGRAVWRFVDLGRIGGTNVEVLRGLATGDTILLSPEDAFTWMRIASRERTP